MAVLPLYLIMLFGIGTQLPIAMSSVPDGIPNLADILSVGNQRNDAFPLDDLRVQISSNTEALSQLDTLLTQLLRGLTLNPTCSEEAFATHVTQTMLEGFRQIPRLFQHLMQSLNLLKLTNWRIDLVRSMGVAEATPEKPCPPPFFMRNNKCIYVETKNKHTFRYGKMVCSAMGGSLIEPEDLKEFAAYIEKIGLGRNSQHTISKTTIEVFVGGIKQEGTDTWQWLSGNTIENIPWDNTDQTHSSPSHCLCVNGHRYKDSPCENLRYFACERPI